MDKIFTEAEAKELFDIKHAPSGFVHNGKTYERFTYRHNGMESVEFMVLPKLAHNLIGRRVRLHHDTVEGTVQRLSMLHDETYGWLIIECRDGITRISPVDRVYVIPE